MIRLYSRPAPGRAIAGYAGPGAARGAGQGPNDPVQMRVRLFIQHGPGQGRYAIPRRDGHILIGSTLEHEGFDKTPTDIALESLKASAVELIPALADAEVVGHWAGLRPGSPKVYRLSVRSLASRGCGSIAGITAMAWYSHQPLASCSPTCCWRGLRSSIQRLTPPQVASTLDRLWPLLQVRLGAVPLLA